MTRIPLLVGSCCCSLLLSLPLAEAAPPGPRAPVKRPGPAKKAPATKGPAAKAPAEAAADAVPPGPGAPAPSAPPAAATSDPAAPASPPAAPPVTPEPPATAAAPAPAEAPAPPPPPPPVLKPDELAVAQRHFQAGEQAFRERKYDAALQEFTTSFEISKQPDLLHNLHTVAIKLGQKDMAIGYLREYMRYRPAETAEIQRQIDTLSATDLKPEPPPPPPPVVAPAAPEAPVEIRRGPSKAVGYTLIGIGALSLATGGALLGAMTAVPEDTGADKTRHRAMLVSGGFLAGAGAIALVGGIVITLRSRSQNKVAIVPSGSYLRLSASY